MPTLKFLPIEKNLLSPLTIKTSLKHYIYDYVYKCNNHAQFEQDENHFKKHNIWFYFSVAAETLILISITETGL